MQQANFHFVHCVEDEKAARETNRARECQKKIIRFVRWHGHTAYESLRPERVQSSGPAPMHIVSPLPSATEIVCQLGYMASWMESLMSATIHPGCESYRAAVEPSSSSPFPERCRK
jgi:hypothetical protein